MSLTSKKKEIKYLYEIKALIIAFFLACGLWYVVVGNDHLESNIAVRVEYGSLPEHLIVADGRLETIYVRVKSSTELLKRLDNSDIIYRVALNDAKKGVNVIPINMSQITDLNGFKLVSVDPQYIVMEVDEIKSKILPIRIEFESFEEDDLYVSNLRISPSMIEVRGAAHILDELEFISIPFDLAKVPNQGHYSRPLQVSLQHNLKTKTPVITLDFDVNLETSTVDIIRPVMIHTKELADLEKLHEAELLSQESTINFDTSASEQKDVEHTSQAYTLHPRAVKLTLEVPTSKITEDTLNLNITSQVEVFINEVDEMVGAILPVEIKLPRHVQLISMEPENIYVEIKEENLIKNEQNIKEGNS